MEDGITGYQFKDCDQEDLQKKLNLMLSDRERMMQMGAAGYRALTEKYNFDRYFETIMQIRDKVIKH